MIKYGIGRNYLPDWSYQEALREIYQNFIDFGEYDEVTVECNDTTTYIELSNNFGASDFQFLKIGESSNRDNANAVGKHGEGLKMAFLVLTRNNGDVKLFTREYEFIPEFYNDKYLGECFGLSVFVTKLNLKDYSFRITFKVPTEEFKKFKDNQLRPEDYIHTCNYGSLINKKPGDIYVGGTYVTNMESIKRAYDFNPTYVELDRDRKVPGTFDVEWTASQIMQCYPDMDINDLNNRDTAYISKIPDNLSEEFVPEIVDKKVVFRAGEIQANDNLKNTLMQTKKNQKRIQKLKFKMCRKRNPHNILKEFFDNYQYSLSTEAKADFKMILTKSKGWTSESNKRQSSS